MFVGLDDNELIEVYKKAVQLKLDEDFIKIIEQELSNRGIDNAFKK